MREIFQLKTAAAACAMVMLLASCGSSSDDSGTPAPAPVPPPTMAQEDAAASASVTGFIAFIQTMIASLTADTNEPRNIGGITPPVTETLEPASI